MKSNLFKLMVTAGTVAMVCACGDDAKSTSVNDLPSNELSSSSVVQQNPELSSSSVDAGNPASSDSETRVNNPCDKVVLTSTAWLLDIGNASRIIYADGHVTDAEGNSIGTLVEGTIVNAAGQVLVANVDPTVLPICEANATVDPRTGDVTLLSSSSANPTSSVGSDPVASSSSVNVEPELDASGFPTLESYGPPPAEYTKDISATAKRGWNTRYWDACKPHCSWLRENANDVTRADTSSDEAYIADFGTARNCNIHDVEVPTFTLGDVSKSWFGYNGTRSACGDEKEKGVFTCTDMAPIAVNDTLSYAYVAGTADSKCGKCYHLQYDGHFANEMENNPPRETHKALKGKHMIVMASNIGNDVAGGNANLPAGQFDLMVPGGGVGAFDALTTQVHKGAGFNWGAGFGGFLTECQNQLGYDATLVAYQTCIKDMCDAAFGDAGLPNLLRGCRWFADWYKAADNPTYYIEEVDCPQYLIDHYMSRFNTTTTTNIKKVTDWSTYKEGDVLDTLHCWKAGEAPPENGWTNPSAGCDNP
ncbi:Glycosyl hydrolase family 45 [Fibrobacter sp. UWT3]|uniref:glycosyl hydrolase family 5 n=1 Tax=Fibrobacter sp. UWT3 TaxID=1896225 RepID=UPI000BCA33A0|nr:glycosyl hydrolase family 5 [Fibrobacter sp. UWT3]SOE75646.1 Glycosyl hydrolase family 45 [Fibrobacter sp. UWT3]